MDNLQLYRTESGIHICGYPDAVGLVPLSSKYAKRLANLSLHKTDLEFALSCLHEINGANSENTVLREALWRSAIVHYLKCFGQSKSRFQLQSKSVYKQEKEVALVVFEYFKSLRDKHLVHDENNYAQSTPVAVINGGGKAFKVEKIACISLVAITINKDNYSNLERLIQKALEWVVSEFDGLCNKASSELEKLPHSDLLARIEDISHNVPSAEDVHTSRAQ